MSTLIQCPACNQKFNMQGRLPALFTCTKCQQPMDLTGFPGYVPEEPAAAKRSAAPERGAARSAGRARGRRQEEEHEEEHHRHSLPAKKGSSNLLLWGLIAGVAVVMVVVIVIAKKNETPAAPHPVDRAAGDSSSIPIGEAPAFKWPPGMDPNDPNNFKKHRKDGSVIEPEAGAAGTPAAGGAAPGSAPGSAPKPPGGVGQIKIWDYPADVTAEERQRIDQALETAVTATGRTQGDAEDALVKLGRKAIWRLVSEFKHLLDTTNFEGRKGKVRGMIVDRTLRKIDGFVSKNTGYKETINPESTFEYMSGVAKRWNDWLERGLYKTEIPPYDPRVDAGDEPKEKPAPSRR